MLKTQSMHKLTHGFNLIELIIVIVIIGILATLALPAYQDQVRKSRRYDATSTLLNIISAQEQYRANNLSYGNLTTVWNGVTTTPESHYLLNITGNSAAGYTLTATAQGTQASDSVSGTSCATLSVVVNGLATTKTPSDCW